MDYFVVMVKERQERNACEGIEALGFVARCFWIEEWRSVRHRKSEKKVVVEVPRWPEYVFVGVEPGQEWMELRYVREVLGVVGVEGVPSRMRGWQFDRLEREINGTSNEVRVEKEFEEGDKVEIRAGQFTGHVGVFVNKNVELLMFGKRVKIRLDPEFLRRVG